MTSDIANEGGPPHEAFGLRLTIAAIARFSALGSFRAQLIGRKGLSKPTVYRHAAGERLPDKDETIALYEKILRIPPGWLMGGAGESLAELREAEAAIKGRDRENPALQKILAYLDAGENHGNVVRINQLAVTHDKFTQIRHIPILSARQIMDFKAGLRTIDAMSMHPAQSIPVINDDDLGPNCIGHQIGAHDLSMTAASGPSFPPGTRYVIDPDREILPGDYIAVRHKREDGYVLRRFVASGRYGLVKDFTLEALGASYRPILVTDVTEYEVAGRLVYTVNKY